MTFRWPFASVDYSLLCAVITFLFTLCIAQTPQIAEPASLDDTEPPNLRKILYPTYAREPYEMENWKFYSGVDVPEYGLWGPMSRYSDLFDRNLRSAIGYVIEEAKTETTPDIQTDGFLPFYSGRG